ncbi:MAG TPA: hypothetical protein VGC42_26620 [Kofleriaceae bacterium]
MPIEELVLYILLVVVGAIPFGHTLVAGEPLGVEATLGLLMIALGALGLARVLSRGAPCER